MATRLYGYRSMANLVQITSTARLSLLCVRSLCIRMVADKRPVQQSHAWLLVVFETTRTCSAITPMNERLTRKPFAAR